MTSSDEYVSMMRRRDYESIIASRAAKRDELLARPNPYEFRHLSVALLRAGRPVDAIKHFERLIEVISPDLRNDLDYCELGAAHWVVGDVEKAVPCWQEALRCNYGDGAKNMSPALLLFYAAVQLSDDALKRKAVDEIEGKLNTGWAKNWPAPLGRFLVDIAGEDQVERELLREHPLRQPDEFCRFDFYRGVKLVESGDKNAVMNWFRSAVDRREQKTSSTEFVLARHELGRRSDS